MSETKGAAMSETAVERRLRDEREEGCTCHRCESLDAGREALALLKKLTNEVTAMLAMAEQVMRSHAGNTNVTVLIQRRDEARALLARCEGSRCD